MQYDIYIYEQKLLDRRNGTVYKEIMEIVNVFHLIARPVNYE